MIEKRGENGIKAGGSDDRFQSGQSGGEISLVDNFFEGEMDARADRVPESSEWFVKGQEHSIKAEG